jgi:hypothetical protein
VPAAERVNSKDFLVRHDSVVYTRGRMHPKRVGINMESPNKEDADNLQQIKSVIAKKAKAGDTEAAQAFAALLEAETNRAKHAGQSAEQQKSATTNDWQSRTDAPTKPNDRYIGEGYR